MKEIKDEYFKWKNIPDNIDIIVKNPEYKSIINSIYGQKISYKIKLSELIEFIITTPIDDPVVFKSKLIKKVRGIKNEIEKLGC